LRSKLPSRLFVLPAVAAFACFAAGCVHPLGPGFNFDNRQMEVRFSPTPPGSIHFHVVDELDNAGDRTLRSLEVRLPQGLTVGEQNVRVQIEGTQISPENVSPTDMRMVRAPFDPPWKQDEKRKVVTEWDLFPESSTSRTMVASASGFFLADETTFPLWQTPSGVFSRGGTDPDKEFLTVVAPQDFRLLAPGKLQKRKLQGNQVEQRFLIDPAHDFLPYVVAGRYQESVIPTKRGEVRFWTVRALDASLTSPAADRVSASMKAYIDYFGPARAGKLAVRIVESPVELPGEFAVPDDLGGASFPQGVLLDPRAFQQTVAGEGVLQLAEYELARTWFGWRVRPRQEAQILKAAERTSGARWSRP
jgi:hypothetical protein